MMLSAQEVWEEAPRSTCFLIVIAYLARIAALAAFSAAFSFFFSAATFLISWDR